jgi:(R,R)-butanediol dehydrogenase/meso-butanediol dehydrogenase/diacetyl reductase
LHALRWHGRRDVRIDDIEKPNRESGFAIVEVELCGVCGTDLEEFRAGPILISSRPHPLTGQRAPVTLGHEFSGRIVDADDEGLPEGARVTADACWRCGRCEMCVGGDYHLCRFGASIGLHSDGAFAQYVRVPSYGLVPLPDEVSSEQGALTDPVGAATALVTRALGGIPLVVERAEGRRGTAERLGLPTLAAGDELSRRVRRALGTGGADVIVDSTGSAAALPDAVECARRGGRIVVVGLAKEPAALDPARLTLFERSLVGSLGYRHDLPSVVAMVAAGLIDPGRIVTGVVPLSEAPATLERLATDPGSDIKVLVRPGG